MYNSFFGFHENPFNLTPDPRYLFMGPSHKEAVEHMLYGINERKGFIVITGGIGTGKTTLCRTLLNHLKEDTRSALIFNSFISDMELLKTINQEFGITMPQDSGTKKDYIDALNRFLLDIFSEGGNAVLIIDEAQNLSIDVLEQIRMLSNLETAKEKLIQIILIGQPELQGVLSSPALRQLNERVTVRCELNPLSFNDVRGYMEHRMIVAGGHGRPRFSNSAVRRIYHYSKGVPRRINNVCDRALLISYALGTQDVRGGIIRKSIRELSGNNNMTAPWERISGRRIIYALLIIVLLASAGFVGWEYKARFFSDTLAEDFKTLSTTDNALKQGDETAHEAPSLYMDEQKSISILFSMFYNGTETTGHDFEGFYPDLVSYDIPPEYYVALKRPFMVSASNHDDPAGYIIVKDTDEKGVIVIGSDGTEQTLDRDFVINNWGGRVSWIYPTPRKVAALSRGSDGPEVLDMQNALNDMGYMVKTTGIYDQPTFQEIMKFQKDFGLQIDGIAGPRTRALLYQMAR